MDKQSKAKQAKQKKHDVENHTDIVNRLRQNKEIDLIKLSLIKRELNCKWGTDIFNALKINRTVTTLSISRCKISEEQLYNLFDALKVNKTITTLIISGIYIGSNGGIALANALLINNTLEVLTLEINALGTQGIISIFNSLKVNKTIKNLNLSRNIKIMYEIDSIAFSNALFDMLLINSSLTILNLNFENLKDSDLIIITKALKKNNTLKVLDIKKYVFTNDIIIETAKMLKVNKTLEMIICGGKYYSGYGYGYGFIKESCCVALIDALKVNYTIIKMFNFTYENAKEYAESINTYLSRNKLMRDSQFWSFMKHNIFPDRCHTTTICSLLSAGRFLPALPEEIWCEYIFPHFRFRDFT